MVDKYGVGSDPGCYTNSETLTNLLDIQDSALLEEAERELSELAASEIDFSPPPYDFHYLQYLHGQLFHDIYSWAGQPRQIDISKGTTRFCTFSRITPEANKLFSLLAQNNWFEDLDYDELIAAVAELYGELNVIHPFREGNGRAQRVLFEHIIVNCGYQIGWSGIETDEWVNACIAGYLGDNTFLEAIFRRCIGPEIEA